MICRYNDGLKVEYSGALLVRKGNEIGGFLVKEDSIPDIIRYELDNAVRNDSCGDLRNIAQMLTSTACGTVCLRR